MKPDEKLYHVWLTLQQAGIDILVMGGHACRYYGIDRNTNDFDLVTSMASPDDLRARLSGISELGLLREHAVWRRFDFARFELGRLPDGREEWLEFWFQNHLLPDFPILKSRAEVGKYGGGEMAFLSLPDLMRSKETERESDWIDIGQLEEIADARNLGFFPGDPGAMVGVLAHLRSRRGMDTVIAQGLVIDPSMALPSIHACRHPVTFAFLLPLVPEPQRDSVLPIGARLGIEPTVLAALNQLPQFGLKATEFGSPKHFNLIEICRRAYRRSAMEADRIDKQVSLQRHQRHAD